MLNACTGRHRLSTINREGRWHPAFRSRLPRRTSPELPAQGPPRRCTEQTPATTEPRAALALMLFRHDGGIRAALARRINRRHTGAWLAKSSGRNAGELIILRCGRGRAGVCFEPIPAEGDLSTKRQAQEANMSHWRDTMVDRPETDEAAYVTGWTISGLAVLGAIVTVWILGI